MKLRRILTLALALCLILSIGAFATSEMPDTSMGGRATSAPPDNSTKPIDELGARAALYIEAGDDGYTVTRNVTDAYTILGLDDAAAPVSGEPYALEGIYLECAREDWDADAAVGNSGIIINQASDEMTPVYIGGAEDVYEGPDGEMYNSVILMRTADDETLASGSQETAPGVGIGFNGSALELNNVYMEAWGSNRATVHIPSMYRDDNVSQFSDLILVDSMFNCHGNRTMLLMGGDVWCLNSTVLTNNHGALSFDMTASSMYIVNSTAEILNASGYAIYDAAGCDVNIYGSLIMGGVNAITICRDGILTTDTLANAPAEATDPYDGEADLLTPAVTEDGRTRIVAGTYPIRIHADMSGADTQAQAYLTNAYLSAMPEEVVFYDGTTIANDSASGGSGISGLISEYNRGAIADITSHNGKVVFDNCELVTPTNLLVHSRYNRDTMASGIYPVDGVEYVGDEVVFRNASYTGDVLHEDYMRKMVLSIENAELTGRVVGTTLEGWNSYWREQVEALPEDELSAASDEMTAVESTLTKVIHDEVYETLWGVRMSVDKDSVWNVTGDSNLYSFTMEDGAVVQGADGQELEIYVDCGMDNSLTAYDTSVGTRIDAFEPGVEYSGVVILVKDGGSSEASGEASSEASDEASGETDLLSALGIETYAEDGSLMISLEGLLDAIGAEVSFDEDTGTITVEDEYGLFGELMDLFGG